jgi:SAM-dependent methyltransferase
MPLKLTADQKAEASFRLEEERIRNTYAARVGEACYAESDAGRFQFQERERQVLRMLDSHGFMPLSERKILEIGCGTGKWLRDLIAWGADPENVFGVELLPASASRARRLCPTRVTIECTNGADLRFGSASFDMVLQATAFTSVLDGEMRRRMAAEMLRVLRPNGIILWYDMFIRNPWNPNTRPIGKRELRQLFPGCSFDLRRVGLAPPLVRWVAPHSWLACYVLARVAPLCTHYLGAIRKPEAQP